MLNLLNEQEVVAWKGRLAEALVSLRESQVLFIEGIRNVVAIANEPRERDSAFGLFVAIDSDTAHHPHERTRPHCSKEWLAQCDREAGEVEASYREAVRESIDHLLGRLQGS